MCSVLSVPTILKLEFNKKAMLSQGNRIMPL